MIYAVPLSALGIGALLGFLLGRARRFLLVLGLILAVALGFAYCMWVPKTGTGYDDIGYAITAFLILMPGGTGLVGGGVIGWLVSRHSGP